jgi:hypothetical protein
MKHIKTFKIFENKEEQVVEKPVVGFLLFKKSDKTLHAVAKCEKNEGLEKSFKDNTEFDFVWTTDEEHIEPKFLENNKGKTKEELEKEKI